MRLTKGILESIIEMAAMIEADGTDQFQGYTSEKEREKAFDSALKAGSWAASTLRKRSVRRRTDLII